VGSAVYHTAVSPYSVEKNSKFLNKTGYTIHNGYMPEDFYLKENTESNEKFTISFIGTLYPTQNIELFLGAFIEFIKKNPEKTDILLLFPGLAYDIDQSQRVINFLKGFEKYYNITERVPKNEIIQIELKTNAFLYTAHDVKGVIGSKIYEYVGLAKPVIFCPSDNDVIEDIFCRSGVGFICNSKEDVYRTISELYDNYVRNNKQIIISTDQSVIEFYSRQSQTKELARILDKVVDRNNLIDDKSADFRSDAFHLLSNIGYNKIVPQIKYATNRISVICFHSISPYKNFSYPPIHPRQFEKIIHYLTKNFQVTSFEEIKQISRSTKPLCVLTFDDGYKDFVEYALPILVKNHIPAIQNIVVESIETGKPFWTQRLNNITNFIHEKKTTFSYAVNNRVFLYEKNNFNDFYMKLFNYLIGAHSDVKNNILSDMESMLQDYSNYDIHMMTWNDIVQCADNNISIGSHSFTHDTLSTIKNDEVLINEIEFSKKIISEKINRPVTSFAFPNGNYNDKVFEIAMKNYDYLLCTDEKTIKKSNFNKVPVIIPRFSVNKPSYWENISKINMFHALFKKEKN
jgi:peptidoglycan/xylan/chitin deacetylase (PgdA/CDA1 family)